MSGLLEVRVRGEVFGAVFGFSRLRKNPVIGGGCSD
jgi:hypothetical protein